MHLMKACGQYHCLPVIHGICGICVPLHLPSALILKWSTREAGPGFRGMGHVVPTLELLGSSKNVMEQRCAAGQWGSSSPTPRPTPDPGPAQLSHHQTGCLSTLQHPSTLNPHDESSGFPGAISCLAQHLPFPFFYDLQSVVTSL